MWASNLTSLCSFLLCGSGHNGDGRGHSLRRARFGAWHVVNVGCLCGLRWEEHVQEVAHTRTATLGRGDVNRGSRERSSVSSVRTAPCSHLDNCGPMRGKDHGTCPPHHAVATAAPPPRDRRGASLPIPLASVLTQAWLLALDQPVPIRTHDAGSAPLCVSHISLDLMPSEGPHAGLSRSQGSVTPWASVCWSQVFTLCQRGGRGLGLAL